MSDVCATASVVIPAYNAEAFVGDAVRSALSQTAALADIIVVDDGSTDETLAVLRLLEEAHPGRMTVLTGPNRGGNAARNRGLEATSGEYIQFLDADDILLPGKIQHQLDLVRGAEADVVAGAFISRSAAGEDNTVVPLEGDPWCAFFAARLGITSANLYRRDAVCRVGAWGEGVSSSQDAELAYRLLKNEASFAVCDAPETIVRRRPQSVWNRNPSASLSRSIALRVEAVEHLRRVGGLSTERVEGFLHDTETRLRDLNVLDPTCAWALEERAVAAAGSRLSMDRFGRAYGLAYRVGGLRAAGLAARALQSVRRLGVRNLQ